MEDNNSWVLPITLPGDFRLPMENMKTRTSASFSAYIKRALTTQLKRDGYIKPVKK